MSITGWALVFLGDAYGRLSISSLICVYRWGLVEGPEESIIFCVLHLDMTLR